MNNCIHLMVDLETMGTKLHPPILQISAVPFSLDQEVDFPVFNTFISLKENIKAGFRPEPDTVKWWGSQSAEAKKAVLELAEASDNTVLGALTDFNDFMVELPGSVYVWGNGSLFDNRILIQAFEHYGLKQPWHYRNDMDLRTLIMIGESMGLKPKDIPFEGVQHDAFADCKHQIKQAKLVMQKMREVMK